MHAGRPTSFCSIARRRCPAQSDPARSSAYLDTQYTALVQVELIGEDDRALKTLSILDLKKVDGQWIRNRSIAGTSRPGTRPVCRHGRGAESALLLHGF